MTYTQKLWATATFCTGIGMRICHSKAHLCHLLSHSNPQQILWQKNILCFSSNAPSLLHSSVSHSPSHECSLNLPAPLGDCSIQDSHPVTKKTPDNKQTRMCGKHHSSEQLQSMCLLSARHWYTPAWSLSSDSVLLFDWEAETASQCFPPAGEATQAAFVKLGGESTSTCCHTEYLSSRL